jgi:hypothetical protein
MRRSRKHWDNFHKWTYECVSKSFRTGRPERELQMVELSATRCNCIAILWVSLVSFATITLCVASQRVFIVVVYFVTDLVQKLLDTPSNHIYVCVCVCVCVCVYRLLVFLLMSKKFVSITVNLVLGDSVDKTDKYPLIQFKLYTRSVRI